MRAREPNRSAARAGELGDGHSQQWLIGIVVQELDRIYILCKGPRMLDDGVRWDFGVSIASNYIDRYAVVGETNLDQSSELDA